MIIENNLYQWHELQQAGMAPLEMMANVGQQFYRNPFSPLSYTPAGRRMAAASELLSRIMHRYNKKPEFGITQTHMGSKAVDVVQETVIEKPFCKLLHFKKVETAKRDQPKLLIVAPMSGHHATLLRGTVEGMLPHSDVYITDWVDARDVPMAVGPWGLDDYIAYVIEFIQALGPDVHLLAVCQPSVPVMAAVSLMSARKDPKTPRSMTLIGGPIDTREAPTKVNDTAMEKPFSWFQSTVITKVPFQYKGFMRSVYPGFVQLTGFLSMNMEKHIEAHLQFFEHLSQGDEESAEKHKDFYDEYLTTADLPAEFYLDTIDRVFQRHLLPKGEMMVGDERVDPAKITKTAILCMEGEHDDISGIGQTKAALKLVPNLPKAKKHYILARGVGHYGLFNGSKFKKNIVPQIVEFMGKHG